MIDILFILLMIIISLFVLIKGADYLVDGATDLARFLRVSPILIGLTVVAFGTSLPEFIVSLFSVLGGSADISLGNIIGSNIANIALIIGFCAVITTQVVRSKTLIYEFPFLIVSSFLLIILGNDFYIHNQNNFLLSRFDGIIFIILFVIFIYYIFQSMRGERKSIKKEFKEEYESKKALWKSILLIVGGILAIVVGGKLFINYASDLAILAGLSEAFIGLTIAALGTSLPELATSGVAAWKKQGDLAIGNIVGSNIFNILFVLGITSLIKPISINSSVLSVDGIIMIFVSLLFLVFATRKMSISRKEGIALLTFYVVYIAFLIYRM
jgi:cation:H+ antiporter